MGDAFEKRKTGGMARDLLVRPLRHAYEVEQFTVHLRFGGSSNIVSNMLLFRFTKELLIGIER